MRLPTPRACQIKSGIKMRRLVQNRDGSLASLAHKHPDNLSGLNGAAALLLHPRLRLMRQGDGFVGSASIL
jgi:hypothetical protein